MCYSILSTFFSFYHLNLFSPQAQAEHPTSTMLNDFDDFSLLRSKSDRYQFVFPLLYRVCHCRLFHWWTRWLMELQCLPLKLSNGVIRHDSFRSMILWFNQRLPRIILRQRLLNYRQQFISSHSWFPDFSFSISDKKSSIFFASFFPLKNFALLMISIGCVTLYPDVELSTSSKFLTQTNSGFEREKSDGSLGKRNETSECDDFIAKFPALNYKAAWSTAKHFRVVENRWKH